MHDARNFLESMSGIDSLVEHDIETCGMCCHQRIMGEVAREMLEAGETDNGVQIWSDRAKARWEGTKFFQLWQEETAAGRDPHNAFNERGWEP